MKLIVYIIMFLMFLFLVNSDGFDVYANLVNVIPVNTCSTASFCGGGYELVCAYFSDGECPENYGDWGRCGLNNYGGRCTPCDLDCPADCGPIEIIVPNVRYPGGTIEVQVNAYGYPGENRFILWKSQEGYNDIFIEQKTVDCVDNVCSSTFNVNVSGDPCDIYEFHVEFYNEIIYINSAYDEGMVSPNLIITSPTENEVVSGVVQITSNLFCEGGVFNFISYYSSQQVGDEIARFRSLGFKNVLISSQESIQWDTTKEYNGNYQITAVVSGEKDGLREPYGTTKNVIINNEGIAESYRGSSILNIILARIRTWL